MATSKPRITVTLSQRQHEVLKSISDCGGQSMSALLGELIEAALPTLERMSNTFQKLRHAHSLERAKMIEAMDEAQAVLEPIAYAAVDQFDLFLGKIEQAVEGVPDGSGATPATPATAQPGPRTNRGVTPSGEKGRKGRQAKVSQSFLNSKVFQKPDGCTCTYTEHERMENKACPVHKARGV